MDFGLWTLNFGLWTVDRGLSDTYGHLKRQRCPTKLHHFCLVFAPAPTPHALSQAVSSRFKRIQGISRQKISVAGVSIVPRHVSNMESFHSSSPLPAFAVNSVFRVFRLFLRSQGWFTSPVREIPDDEYPDQVQDWQG